jgi:rhomboid-related protein 1/2/3
MIFLKLKLVNLFLLNLFLVHCWWRVSLVYLAGVLAGSMGTSLMSPSNNLAGASGGVYALITAHIATIVMNGREMNNPILQFIGFFTFCMFDIGFSAYRHIINKNDRVGYVAHLCGGIAGLLVGIGVLRNLKERNWEKKLWWTAMTIYFLLMIAGICIHIFCPAHFPNSKV